MHKAFTFGKFLPFHKGHEAMIRFGLAHCDRLTVLVCRSDKESLPGEIRAQWIAACFPDEARLEIRVLDYKESELPNSSVSSRDISAIWSAYFRKEFPDVQSVITSEPYGDFVAEYMGVKHIPFDIPRHLFPVSATRIRNDLKSFWPYLPDSVKPFLVTKVVILGTESTGKSTFAAQLTREFDATLVSEAGRDLIPDSSEFAFEDLYRVLEAHQAAVDQAIRGQRPLVILDTDWHITQSYARFTFERSLDVPASLIEAQRAQLYLYQGADAPYVQDGTRMSKEARDALDRSHQEVLEEYGVVPVWLTGDWEARWEEASTALNEVWKQRQAPLILA